MNTNKPRQNILVQWLQWLQWFKIQGRLQHNSCPRPCRDELVRPGSAAYAIMLDPVCIRIICDSFIYRSNQIYTLTLPQQNCTSSWIPDLHSYGKKWIPHENERSKISNKNGTKASSVFLVHRVEWFHRNLLSNEGSSFSRLVESFLAMFLQGGDVCVEWSKTQMNATVFVHSFHDIH